MTTKANQKSEVFLQRESLAPYAKVSFFIHFLAMVILFFFSKKFNFLSNHSNITTIVPAIRVDIVGMPKMTLKEIKNLSSGVEEKKIIESQDDLIQENSFKTKSSRLSDILKLEAKKEINANDQDKNMPQKTRLKGDISKLILEGNKISKGMAVIGDTRQNSMGHFSLFVSSIPDFVRPNWRLPAYLLDSRLNCRIRIYLDARGKLLKAEIFESSKNQEYDMRALRAVMASSFPKPYKEIVERVQNGHIILGFPL